MSHICRDISCGFDCGSVCNVLGYTKSEELLLSKTGTGERITAAGTLPPIFAMSTL